MLWGYILSKEFLKTHTVGRSQEVLQLDPVVSQQPTGSGHRPEAQAEASRTGRLTMPTATLWPGVLRQAPEQGQLVFKRNLYRNPGRDDDPPPCFLHQSLLLS